MSNSDFKGASVAAIAATVTSAIAEAADAKTVDKLIAGIKDKDEQVRTDAWLGAGQVGAPAVKPLAKVMTDNDLEVARAAKRGLWKLVRHSGRPEAGAERKAVEAELVGLLGDGQPVSVRREVLWMLSEVGSGRSVDAIAALLSNNQLREDARMTLQRIPNKKALAALNQALDTAPDDFKLNIAQSLRQRGVKVKGLACVKLVPTKKTSVEPVK
ncbi:MAG TPA: HEAT repeat domain-containing protein [Sedimentisphaerales bacterium]|nr:HEAT repeat domain-containing protein [Sedimentisphaerales bacterium]